MPKITKDFRPMLRGLSLPASAQQETDTMDMNKTAILFILDRSASMGSIASEVVSEFNAMIEEQAQGAGEATVTLVQFNNKYVVDYVNLPMAEVPPLNFRPASLTAMVDAVCRGINELGNALREKPEDERPGRVIVIIMTDGRENSSKEFTHQQMRAMIKEQREKYSWEFVFSAANIDADAVGSDMGVGITTDYVADRAGVRVLFRGMGVALSSFRSGTGYALEHSHGDAKPGSHNSRKN